MMVLRVVCHCGGRGRTLLTRNISSVLKRGLAGVALAGVGVLPLSGAAHASTAASSTWDKLAQCESGGNWHIDTGNGYQGGLQFSPSTWKAYGGTGSAADASKAEQIRIAQKVQQSQGWGAWPSCSQQLGLNSSTSTGAGDSSEQRQQPKQHTDKAPRDRTAPPTTKSPDTGTPPTTGKTYTVQPGDTLASIAQPRSIIWHKLYDANRDRIQDPNQIFVGQVLRLPA